MAKKTAAAAEPAAKSPIERDPLLQFDARVVEHLRRRGVLDHAAYEAHLLTVPDEASEAEEAHTRFSVRGR
jgi:hypothetical protein